MLDEVQKIKRLAEWSLVPINKVLAVPSPYHMKEGGGTSVYCLLFVTTTQEKKSCTYSSTRRA